MSKILSILIVLSFTGCYGSQIAQLERDNAEMRDQNRRLRAAQADGWQPPGHPAVPSQAPTAPSVAGQAVVGNGAPGMNGGMVGNGQVSTGAMIARQKPAVYMGATGAQPRQVTMGPKLQLVNKVCDNGSRDMWSNCTDADRNGWEDYNTFLSFEIDGQPVVCDSRFVHPQTRMPLLAPDQTCFVELGRSSIVHLTVKAYRNFGTPDSIMLPSAPNVSKTVTVDLGVLSNVKEYKVAESLFW